MLDLLQHGVVGACVVEHPDVEALVALPLQHPLPELALQVEDQLPVDLLVVGLVVDLHHHPPIDQDVHREVLYCIAILLLLI